MKNIFVICASEQRARANYRKTILNPIPEDCVLSCFPAETHAELRAWQQNAGGFFAWGVRGGPRMETMMRGLESGDCVLGFFDFHYQSIARLIGKTRSVVLAEMLWGDPGWENVIFMTRPREVKVPASLLQQYLCSTYRGASRLAAHRINHITTDFGSVEEFTKKYFGNQVDTPS